MCEVAGMVVASRAIQGCGQRQQALSRHSELFPLYVVSLPDRYVDMYSKPWLQLLLSRLTLRVCMAGCTLDSSWVRGDSDDNDCCG